MYFMKSLDKKICAGIVTYNPDLDRLRENIEHIKEQVEVVFIADNGSTNIDSVFNLSAEYRNVRLVKLPENQGIARALNILCKSAYEMSYDWIITLDQDSVSPDALVSSLVHFVGEDIAVISPNIEYRNNNQYTYHTTETSAIVEWAITSASLTSLKVWQILGGFDDKLFIDYVDYDFCIRAKQKGYKTIRVYSVVLLHELGRLSCKKIFGKTVHVTNHSAFRYYYMSRNALYIEHKLHTINAKKEILKLLIKILVFEESKIEKIRRIYRGIKDSKMLIDIL